MNNISLISRTGSGAGSSRAKFKGFEPNRKYKAGDAVIYDGSIYTAKADFTSSASFDANDWDKVSTSEAELDGKLDREKTYGNGVVSRFFHEDDGGGYEVEDTADDTVVFSGANVDATPVKFETYAKNKTTGIGTRIIHTLQKIFYTKNKPDSTVTDDDEIATVKTLNDLVGLLNTITNSTDKSTVVAAFNTLFRFKDLTHGNVVHSMGNEDDGGYITGQDGTANVRGGVCMNGTVPQMYFETAAGTKTFRVLVEVHNDGLYISRAIAAPDWGRMAEMADLEPLITEIQGLHGKTARLNGYDFGMGITSDNIDDADIQIMLNAYAMVQLGVSDVSDIPNFIGVHNLYDGEGGNHLLIFNQAIVGSGTPENPEFPAHWVDNGLDSVSIASNTSLGVVKGSSADMKIGVETDGTMSVNGLSTKLSEKENSENKTDVIRAADTADNEHYPTELAVRTGLDAAGRVDTVNGIPPDINKNINLTPPFATEEAFEAAKDSLPPGTLVIKEYEYPDNLAGYMMQYDLANVEDTNRLPTRGSTWTVDRLGYIKVRLGYVNGSKTTLYIDNVLIQQIATGGSIGASGWYGPLLVRPGNVVRIEQEYTSVWDSGVYFIPPLFVKKELPIIVEKNGSYSLDEVKTADTWIDGKPIYKKTFTTTGPTTTPGAKDVNFTITGLGIIVKTERLMETSTQSFPVGSIEYNSSGQARMSILTGVDGNNHNTLVVQMRVYESAAGWINGTVYITAFYTKLTD